MSKANKMTITKPLTQRPTFNGSNNVDVSKAKPKALRTLFRYDFLSTREYTQRFGK